ncbi:hypothetical protein CEXT_464341 [Caerostris extrusa]|uniref:Uncharacterized protein n=1 Tax=Caerostris extrusa TaxID=172846 RepID=A0AAV4NH42_CAEEX|nr:hypothetical protein CEXT_464341 [Caerostris extrusa]
MPSFCLLVDILLICEGSLSNAREGINENVGPVDNRRREFPCRWVKDRMKKAKFPLEKIRVGHIQAALLFTKHIIDGVR